MNATHLSPSSPFFWRRYPYMLESAATKDSFFHYIHTSIVETTILSMAIARLGFPSMFLGDRFSQSRSDGLIFVGLKIPLDRLTLKHDIHHPVLHDKLSFELNYFCLPY